ncbi:hypothetical protein WJX73_004088 [Symbiochloris irregularis]|uniref:Uncharacterized protein n=1 Tax=Symbiochloris irregularis TaxID=706552 RepID=A0AAW1NXA3_9CHLO
MQALDFPRQSFRHPQISASCQRASTSSLSAFARLTTFRHAPKGCQRRPARCAVRASQGQQAPPEGQPSLSEDAGFFIKLAASSVAGAVTVKYGSLFLDAPFNPTAKLALLLCFGPCAVYSVILLLRQS